MLRKLRIYFRIFIRTVLRYRMQALLASVCILVVVGLMAWFFARFFSIPQSVFIEGLVGKYTKQTLPPVVENLASIGLTKIEPDGSVASAAATSWEVSPDGKTYTFHLAKNLHWQDGTPFRAQDLTSLFETVETKVISDHDIQFTLKSPYSPFPSLLAEPLFKGDQLVGLGDFQITSWNESQGALTEITLARKQPYQKLTFRFYSNSGDLLTAFQLGELQAMRGFLNPAQVPDWPSVVVKNKVTTNSVVAVLFNTQDKFFADKAARQALTYALARQNFPGEEAVSPIPPSSWAYFDDVKRYVPDKNHAKELLGKKDIAPNTKISVTTTAAYEDLTEQLAQDWQQIGLAPQITVAPDVPKNFQVAVVRLELPRDPDQYTMWHSLQKATNITGYADERVDKLLEDGRTTADQQARTQRYRDFQRFLVEDVPVAFLYYPKEYLVINKRFNTPFFNQINGF